MDNKNFVHLHVHTSFSIKDGVAGIDDYIKKCEEYQMPAVAITDHGSIGGFPKFYVSTRESSIKPIFGVEVYVQNERDKLESVINDVSKFHEKVKEIQKLVNTKKFTKVQWDKNPKILMKAFQIDNIDSNMIKECNKNIQNGKRRLKKIQEIYQQKYKETTEIRDRLRRNTHLILLAKNKEGFRNIIKICNDASVNGFYYKPRTSIDFISKNKDGLIVSSACLAGPLCQIYWKYKDNDKFDEEKIFEEMVNTAKWYKETFENFYIEIMLNSIEDQKNVNKILIRVAKHLNIDFIITNDAHYISPEGAKAQEISLMLGSKDDGKQVTMKDKTKFGIMRKIIDSICNNEISIKEIENILENNDEVQRYNLNTEKSKLITAIEIKDVMLGNRKLPKIWGFSTTDFWFKNYTEMIEIWKSQHEYLSKEDFEKGLENTIKVSNLVEKFDLDLSAKLPVVDTGNKNQYEYLVELAKIGWKKKIKGIIKDEKIYKKRLMTELKVINILDISGYLIIVADYINWAKNNNILVGCGRGSSAGSLVCYLLNITEIDPIQHKLLFERFISVARSMALYNFKLENINEEKLSLNFNKSEILKWKNKKKILMVI